MFYTFVFLLSLVFVTHGYAGQEEFYESVDVTDTNTTVTIDLDQCNDRATEVWVINDGDDVVYYDVLDGVAETTENVNFKLLTDESRCLGSDKYPITVIGLISDTTAVVRIGATCGRCNQ